MKPKAKHTADATMNAAGQAKRRGNESPAKRGKKTGSFILDGGTAFGIAAFSSGTCEA